MARRRDAGELPAVVQDRVAGTARERLNAATNGLTRKDIFLRGLFDAARSTNQVGATDRVAIAVADRRR